MSCKFTTGRARLRELLTDDDANRLRAAVDGGRVAASTPGLQLFSAISQNAALSCRFMQRLLAPANVCCLAKSTLLMLWPMIYTT